MQKNNIIEFPTKRNFKTFEIFKGIKTKEGFIKRKRSLGSARLFEGSNTYYLFIKTLLGDRFYLLPEQKNTDKYDFVILTREESKREGKKYYWSVVGEGLVLMGQNQGLMKINWDFFGGNDIYMRLEPVSDENTRERKGELDG